MVKAIKVVAIGSLLAASALYGANVAACVGCHGQKFEKKALGVSKIVKDMSKEDIIKALKGYKDGSYGGAQKGVMKGQVAALSDKDIEDIANTIKGSGDAKAAPAKESAKASAPAKKVVNINAGVDDPNLIKKQDLGAKKEVSETELGLRGASVFKDDVTPPPVKEDRPAPGAAPKFERSYVNAPPLIPHSVDGLLPITRKNNACLGCHMPDKAKASGATPIPPTHFTDYRPKTKIGKNGEVIKEGKAVKNTSDVVTVAHTLKTLSMARYNCSQCHVPQANVKPLVGNTFKPEGLKGELKTKSNLYKVINEGVK